MNDPGIQRSIKILGAGFSGLSAAYYLTASGRPVELFEAEKKPGGLIHTKQSLFGPVETAANAVLNSAHLEAMAENLGLKFLRPLPTASNRYILRGGLRRWPLNSRETLRLLWGVVSTRFRGNPIFQARPKESVAAWANRVFGVAANHYFLEPALQGIYGAGTQELSGNLVLNSFAAARRAAKELAGQTAAAKRPKFRGSTAPEGGMGAWIRVLAENVERNGSTIHYGHVVRPETLQEWLKAKERILLATDLRAASHLLTLVAPEIAERMARLPRISLISVTTFFPKTKNLPQGFGCLFPMSEEMHALGVLWNSCIFPGRTAGDQGPQTVSETWIFGGSANGSSEKAKASKIAELLAADDDQILSWIYEDRKRLIGADAAASSFNVNRWPEALPCYGMELEEWLAGGDRELLRENGIELHGNYLGRLGLSGILASSAELPNRIWRR